MSGMHVVCYDYAMCDSTNLLQQIAGDRDLVALLANVFEFDVRRRGGSESPRLTSGVPVEAIAGDFTGGTFYSCGSACSSRPVLYASSEGEAGIIAASLNDALELVVGFPYWRDCLKYSADGDLSVMESAEELLRRDMMTDFPNIKFEQSRVAEALCIPLKPSSVLVARLHAAVKGTKPNFIFSDETGEYGELFGSFSPQRNPLWR